MKNYVKGIVVGLIISTMLFVTVGTFAAGGVHKAINVMMNQVNIAIDGEVVGETGNNYVLSNGNEVPYSIVYKGTTYLPIRKVAELLDMEVTWDGDTMTAGVASVQGEEEPEPETEPQPEIKNIGIGETTSFAEWEYKVLGIEKHKAIKEETARGKYIVFMIEVKNNAKMERELSYFFQAQDKEGRIFSFDTDASLAHYHAYRTDTWYLGDIGPSFTAVMPIVFDVPEDVEALYLYPKDLREEDLGETQIIKIEIDAE